MIVGIGAGTFMLREAANVALVIGDQTESVTGEPTISAYLDTPEASPSSRRTATSTSPTRTTT